MELDRYDRLILDALQNDGRVSNVQLAQAVNLSESACLRRVRALEDEGFIDKYAALLNQTKAGLSGNVFCTSVCTAKNKASLRRLKKLSGEYRR